MATILTSNRPDDRSAASVLETDLLKIAKSIDPIVRRHCATWGLRRLLSKPHNTEDMGKAMFIHVPSPWTLIAVTLMLAAAASRAGALGLALWPIIAVTVAAAFWFEARLLPRIVVFGLKFQLMRFEKRDDEGDLCFMISQSGRSPGFGTISFSAELGSFYENEIVAVATRGDLLKAIIRLRLDQRLHVFSITRNVGQDAVLPPMTTSFVDLAQKFGEACNHYQQFAGEIDQSRAIRVSKEQRPTRSVEDAWSGIILDQALKERLINSATHFKEGRPSASKGLLLYGPPGTGKTLIAKALAESMGCTFFARTLSELKAGYVGQSAGQVKELWKQALNEKRAVIFLDECDAVFARRDDGDAFVKDIVNSFIAEWDGLNKQRTVWVIGATNRKDQIDHAVLSRFGEQVSIGMPGPEQRLEILRAELKKGGYRGSLPEEAEKHTQGMGGRDLEGLAGALLRSMSADEIITGSMLAERTNQIRKQASDVTDDGASWQSLILPPATLSSLKRIATQIQHVEMLKKQNLPLPRALLLYGPPGTGKTQIARTLANETKMHFLSASTADLKGNVIGQSGKNVKTIFDRARENAPTLLFIDEIDLVAGVRGDGDSYTAEMVGQFLQEMDGIVSRPGFVFVLAATNRSETLDSAILSRFPSKIEIPLPDEAGRRAILEILMAGRRVDFAGEDVLSAIAAATAGLSGRELRSLYENALGRSIDRATDLGGLNEVVVTAADFS